MESHIQVLLVSLDALFRKALARECRTTTRAVRCLESDDGMGAMLAPALERMDLVLLDTALVHRHGAAWLTNWRRMVPRGSVLVLDPHNERTFAQVREAVMGVVLRAAPAR